MVSLGNATMALASAPAAFGESLVISSRSFIQSFKHIWISLDLQIPSGSELLGLVLVSLLALMAYEQISVYTKSRHLPGPRLPLIPFFGTIFTVVKDPHAFYETQAAMGQISWNYFLGRFVVFTKDPGAIRRIFTSPSFTLFLLDNAKVILNLPYVSPSTHHRIRQAAFPLFSSTAVAKYVPVWEREMRGSLKRWVEEAKEGKVEVDESEIEDVGVKERVQSAVKQGGAVFRMRPRIYTTASTSSIHALIGVRNLPSGIGPDDVAKMYTEINEGLLSLPINLPGTPMHTATKSRTKLISWVSQAVENSRSLQQSGVKPESVLDHWVAALPSSLDQPSRDAEAKPKGALVSDSEITLLILDLFFAAQDATVSATTSIYILLAAHPAVVEKLKEEQVRLRGKGLERKLDAEVVMEGMVYGKKVVREVLRMRVPPPMVPHVAVRDTTLPPAIDGSTPEINIKKGTIVIPSIVHGARNTAVDDTWDRFDPDRVNPPMGPYDEKPYWVFGAGQHLCIGKEYAVSHLLLHLALLLELAILDKGFQFERVMTKDANVDILGPSVFPKDGGVFVWGLASAAGEGVVEE